MTGNYKTQYYLTVTSPYDSPSPESGWFDSGSSITESVTSPASGGSGIQYVCTGWTGTGSVPSSGSDTTTTFQISAPSTVVWNWNTQYYLTVTTDPKDLVTIPGEGWYDTSTLVTLTAPPVTNYVFDNWTVDGVSQGNGVNSVSVTMNSGHTALAYYASSGAVPDVAVLNLTVSKTIAAQGCSVAMNVTVENQAVGTASFNVTVYVNVTTIGFQIDVLEGGNSTVFVVVWNTTGFGVGNYTVSAYAGPLAGETDTADNNFTGGWIIVSMVGDITGPDGWPDGKCDMRDIGLVARHFGETVPPAPANCDLTGPIIGVQDGKIDMRDIGLVARHFGEHL